MLQKPHHRAERDQAGSGSSLEIRHAKAQCPLQQPPQFLAKAGCSFPTEPLNPTPQSAERKGNPPKQKAHPLTGKFSICPSKVPPPPPFMFSLQHFQGEVPGGSSQGPEAQHRDGPCPVTAAGKSRGSGSSPQPVPTTWGSSPSAQRGNLPPGPDTPHPALHSPPPPP